MINAMFLCCTLLYGPLNSKVCLSCHAKYQRYNKYLTNLLFPVLTISYGSSFFSARIYGLLALRLGHELPVTYSTDLKLGYLLYLEGVIGVRSSPTVLITRRPHTNSPMHMPTPPYTRIQTGIRTLSCIMPDQ